MRWDVEAYHDIFDSDPQYGYELSEILKGEPDGLA